MLIKRRSFIKTSALASASLLTPQLWANQLLRTPGKGEKVLVVLQLTGANDGLNTVIPFRNDVYYQSRPGIAIAKSEALGINDEYALHPELKNLQKLYGSGELAIINGVGYPENSRSHFRSMDIWQSASEANEYLSSGWIGRYLDEINKSGSRPTKALEIDDLMSLALKGDSNFGLAVKDPKKLFNATQSPFIKKLARQAHEHEHEHTVDYLYQTLTQTVNSAEYIFKEAKVAGNNATYPSNELGQGLKTIASLINSDIDTSVYYISHNGFDTHNDQLNRQARLFRQMDEALGAFVEDLKSKGRFEDVVIMTFSEFGRRVVQNGSNGTDHGAASCMFMLSGGLRNAGVINEMPSLTDLYQGDLKYSVDFRQVYATILDHWLGVNHGKILGGRYELMDFV